MATIVLFLAYWSLRAALKFSSLLGRTGINVITRVLGICWRRWRCSTWPMGYGFYSTEPYVTLPSNSSRACLRAASE